MTDSVTIVRLTPQDWESHRELRLEALATNPEAFGATYADNAAYDEETWRARLAAVTYWQAREGSMPRGLVGLWDPLIDAGELDGAEATPFLIALFVCPSARGRGIGAALVEAVLVEARARGHRRVLLDVRASNRPARALYERLGFVLTDERVPDSGAGGCEVSLVRGLGHVDDEGVARTLPVRGGRV